MDNNEIAKRLGRAGGLKGGKARSEALSPERRSEIAKLAAATRWKNQRDESGMIDDPAAEIGCQDPNHLVRLLMMVIPPGKAYRHVCPACGAVQIIRGGQAPRIANANNEGMKYRIND